MMMKTACLAAVVAACGVDPAPAPPTSSHDVAEHSGARLVLEWWELVGGGLQVRGVYDTRLGQECAFHGRGDGTYACVPASGDASAAAIATLAPAPGDSRVVPEVLTMADGFVLPHGFFDRRLARTCEPRAVLGDAIFACARPGAPVSSDDPLLALVIDPSPDGRLARRSFESADGLVQHSASFFDTELGVDCSVRAVAGPSDGYCLPPEPANALGSARVDPTQALARFVPAVPTIDP